MFRKRLNERLFITAHNQAHTLAWLPARLPEHCHMLLVGRADSHAHVLGPLRQKLDPAQFVTLAPLSEADAERALTRSLAGP